MQRHEYKVAAARAQVVHEQRQKALVKEREYRGRRWSCSGLIWVKGGRGYDAPDLAFQIKRIFYDRR